MCFNIRTEKVTNWRDYLRLHCYPIDKFIDEWPTNLASFQAHLAEYCQSTRNLALQLIVAISESLGLHKDYMNTQLGKHAQHMVLNYYPACSAIVNCDKERISIPTFYCPSPEAVIRPTSEVVSDDAPAVYRQFTYGEYYEKFNGL
ncbi:putative flavanone 3-dioxygenase [Helianthus annuus]|uniref:Flavanone 3-dioxygenase n=1 Tax=Helianthus annuus TaxID=4232 RepID=A0A9K3DS86_HELAN|nr:putative flavanone 3-dioxygenase [Helianthus annuus]KAJ0443447.1 putative flavanone 3-dioxygenase [Helianthus annuus]KAJ0460959.1 putative flavanone 3-dioxygenase [Helianthus annuus]KAJ0821758.1 putative flavanone 3-dioxygenase [Helianthus annuus]